ncbi:hypothetical protein [Longimicrobium sp.]|uniref:hypothetical protein n=1 Tax=Longimicrobium sp. TaxID=2029185 RepID=UPI002D01D97D|nr:hypothetical protein [Longimicrobium sp.]HSU16299.1 hypothetical protein [Longimicrobium sp.]
MFGSEILEVAIGIIFIYILVSVICSAVREGIEAFMKTRSAYLEHGIRELLHDADGKGLAESFFKHPLIYGLYLDEYKPRPPLSVKGLFPWTRGRRPSYAAKGSGLPSYIPTKSFALALMDLAARGPATNAISSSPESTRISLDSIRQNVENLGNPGVQRALLTALDTAQNDLDKLQANLEAWYDSAMDRVSGWYKRSSQWIILVIGFAVAVAFNVNTLTIADYLYRNDAARQALVARAETAARDSTFVDSMNYKRARLALDSLSLPIGWTQKRIVPKEVDTGLERAWFFIGIPFFGWLMTGIAATMGAPFWFDLLNKVMVIRSTVKPREKSREEGSEDRQPKKDAAQPQVVVQVPPAAPAGGGGAGGGGGGGGGPGAAAPPAASLPPAPGSPGAPDPGDVEADVDACAMEMDDETPDDELPAAEGGVQP